MSDVDILEVAARRGDNWAFLCGCCCCCVCWLLLEVEEDVSFGLGLPMT